MQSTMRKSMKITICFVLLLAEVRAGAQTGRYLSYTINLKRENVTISVVLKEITRQTGLRFMSAEDVLPLNEKVSVSWVNISLEKALPEIFAPRGLVFKIQDGAILVRAVKANNTVALPATVPDTSYAVSGTITDSTGVPLPGAYILLKGTKRGTVSGSDGRFMLNHISGDGSIIVTYTGFKSQEISTQNNPFLKVRLLADAKSIQQVEIISTGYQTLSKERAPGSFDFISNKLYNEQTGPDVLSRLEGISNSLVVNRNIDPKGAIIIRGISTISGPRAPLIILDNFPYDGDINNINPNDVENITILKDAAASSIWGARAGNGVIVITTKKGKYDQAIGVSFNANMTVSGKPDLYYLRDMSPADLIEAQQFAFDHQYYSGRENDTYNRTPLPQAVEYMIAARDGKISAGQLQDSLDMLRKHDIRRDLQQYMYQTSVHQQYALSVNGGGQVFSWILSSGYDNDISNLDALTNKLNFRSYNTFKPTKNLELSAGIYYTDGSSKGGGTGYNSVTTNYGLLPVYTSLANTNGSPATVIKDYRQSYLDTAGGGRLPDWNYYPLTDYKYNHINGNNQDILINTGISYKPLDFLSIDLRYQYEQSNIDQETLYDQQSYYARNMVNSYASIDYTNNIVSYPIPVGAIQYLSTSVLKSWDYRSQISLNKSWGRSRVAAIAGNEIRNAHTRGFSTGNYGLDPNSLTFGNINYNLIYPQFVNGSGAYITNPNDLSDLLDRFVSYFGNAAYTYNDKYTVSASGRRDASNLFGASTNNKWKPLWSAGASWDVSKEDFYHLKWLPFLKLRGTYGFSGNVDQSRAAVSTIAYYGSSTYTGMPYSAIISYNNPDLRWEKVSTFNLGLDFGIGQGIVAGSVEYFHKVASDLYGSAPVDYTVGVGGPVITKNTAKISGNGVDLSLKAAVVRREFNWDISLEFNYYKDKIVDYYIQNLTATRFANAGSGTVAGIKGKSVYSVYAYKWGGLDAANGDPQGYLAGKLSKDYSGMLYTKDLSGIHYMGSAIPTYFGSFGSNMSWKGFSLAARLTYKFGYKFHAQGLGYAALFSNSQGNLDFEKRWKHPGDEKVTNVPSMTYPANGSRDAFYKGSDVLVNPGGVIRLQYITLSYDILHKRRSTSFFKTFQVYSNLNNLGIIWKANKTGIDPEYLGQIPPKLNVAFGFRSNF